MKVYTKTGDKGETALVGGQRISKDNLRIDLYGEVDELNSYTGFLTVSLKSEIRYKNIVLFLEEIQSRLFDLGSNLASEKKDREKFKLPQVGKEMVEKLEKAIDDIDEHIPDLKNFVLPGGVESSSRAHLCRVYCRRVERRLVNFSNQCPGEVPEQSHEFLNRLSDYFFMLSRYLCVDAGEPELIWKP